MSEPAAHWGPRHDGRPDRDRARGEHALAERAIAEREQGRARLNSTTVTVGFASVAVAAVVGFTLPGPASHATTTKPATTGGQGQQNQGDPGNSGLNPPAYAPAPVPAGGGGNPVSTSGGTSSGGF